LQNTNNYNYTITLYTILTEKYDYLKLIDKSPPESIMQDCSGKLRQKYFLPFYL